MVETQDKQTSSSFLVDAGRLPAGLRCMCVCVCADGRLKTLTRVYLKLKTSGLRSVYVIVQH